MAKGIAVRWPGRDFVYIVEMPEDAADSTLDKRDELIIALDAEIKRLERRKG